MTTGPVQMWGAATLRAGCPTAVVTPQPFMILESLSAGLIVWMAFVMVAAGAFERSHCLNWFRPAVNWARYDRTALPLKSIFLPCAGLVPE